MKLTDKIGNELQRADLVTFSAEELVGVISEIDSGEIARPLSVQGGVTADARFARHHNQGSVPNWLRCWTGWRVQQIVEGL